MPDEINYFNNFLSSDISDSQYVSQGGELNLSNIGQLELLLAMVESGVALRTTARGFSMQPFIRDKDVLTISPIKDMQPSLGDVVAFTHPDTGRLAIHRIIGRTDDGWLIRGDNCPDPDGVVEPKKLSAVFAALNDGERKRIWESGKLENSLRFLIAAGCFCF